MAALSRQHTRAFVGTKTMSIERNLLTGNGGTPDAAGCKMQHEVHVLQSGENDWNLTRKALREQLNKGGHQDVQVTDHMIVTHLPEFYRANEGRTDNRGHRLDNEPSWNNIADGTEIHIPKFDLSKEVPTPPQATEVPSVIAPPVTPPEPPKRTVTTPAPEATPEVPENVPEVPTPAPTPKEPDKSAAEPAKLKPTAAGAYNPIAPPGLDFEPGELSRWQWSNHYSSDKSFAIRYRNDIVTDNLNGTKTHRYEGGFNDSYSPFGDMGFTAEETLDNSGKLLRRRVEYNDTIGAFSQPILSTGINFDGIDFQGPGGTTHHVNNVKTIDTDFDARIGKYKTVIKTRDGKEYTVRSNANGEVEQWQDPLES